jgi:hypothetical protein
MSAREYLTANNVEEALAAAVAQIIKDRPKYPLTKIAELLLAPRIKTVKAYWHLADAGMGNRGEQYAKTEAAASAYVAALHDVGQKLPGAVEKFGQLFAEDGVMTMEDPVGTPPMKSRQALSTFFETTPVFSSELKLVKVALDELKAAVWLQNTAGGATIDMIDELEFDAAGKLLSVKAFWHLGSIGVGKISDSVPMVHKVLTDMYAGGLTKMVAAEDQSNAALFSVLADDGVFSMQDPIGTPAMTTRDAVSTFFSNVPRGIIYTPKLFSTSVDEKQIAMVLQIEAPGAPPMLALDILELL